MESYTICDPFIKPYSNKDRNYQNFYEKIKFKKNLIQ